MNITEFDLKEYLKNGSKRLIESLMDYCPSDSTTPARLHEAMRYSVFAGGKRLRPILVVAAAEAVSGGLSKEQEAAALQAGAALEVLHTYSLVHDDLPMMDNDDLRRGKPTCHKAFDEATAMLVGDGLQSIAFEFLATIESVSAEDKVKCIEVFAKAVGSQGMVGGQMADLECEGKGQPTAEDVEYIHHHKTGALIRSSCVMGAILGGGSQENINSLAEYGISIGLAFQIIDDILDVVGSAEALGKSIGKDESSDKATYPAVYGMDKAREMAEKLIEQAKNALTPFGESARPLAALADFVASRDR